MVALFELRAAYSWIRGDALHWPGELLETGGLFHADSDGPFDGREASWLSRGAGACASSSTGGALPIRPRRIPPSRRPGGRRSSLAPLPGVRPSRRARGRCALVDAELAELLLQARRFGIVSARLALELKMLPDVAPGRRAEVARQIAEAYKEHGGKAGIGADRLRDLAVAAGLFQLPAPGQAKPRRQPGARPPAGVASQAEAREGVGQLFAGARRFARHASGSPDADKDKSSSR